MSRGSSSCAHCGQALDALTQVRRLTHCGRAACRQAAEAQRRRHQLDLTADTLRAAAHAAGRPADPVVWLRPAGRDEAEVTPAEREALRRHLLAQIADDASALVAEPAPLEPDGVRVLEPEPSGIGAQLCGTCAGRCCWQGLGRHAFLDRSALARWCAANPGRTLADAVDAYLARLPARHIAGSCLYHTTAGCSNERSHRADICNEWRCTALEITEARGQDDPAAAVLALTAQGDQVIAAAVVAAGGRWPVALRAPPTPPSADDDSPVEPGRAE